MSLLGKGLGRLLGVEHKIPSGLSSGEVEKGLSDPYVELIRLALDAISTALGGGPAAADSRIDVKHYREIGNDAIDGEPRECRHFRSAEPTPDTLIRD